MLEERRWELAFEGHRWFDLKRTGRLLTTLRAEGRPIEDHHLVFPIPQREIDVNRAMQQSPGY